MKNSIEPAPSCCGMIRGRIHFLLIMASAILLLPACKSGGKTKNATFELKIEQLTSGEKHHFFGYIGQCLTIPWNATGQYILGLEIGRIDRMPEPEEAATIFILDTRDQDKIIRLDSTHAWNPQQGTMFYWNPLAPETQFFFNDRDVESGKVFTVVYDIKSRSRVKEYRYEDTPIGNGGVAPDGSAWLGLNYGRMARLRLVTGYPGALDWSRQEIAPRNDGVHIVDIPTGERQVLVSFFQMDSMIRLREPDLDHSGFFINHTLWNRNSNQVYFFARAGWSGNRGERINIPFTVNADGTELSMHEWITGHPEWGEGNLVIGMEETEEGDKQIFYDVKTRKIVGQIGTTEMFPKPGADVSLSPSGDLFVNGYGESGKNYYAVYRFSDGAFARSEGIDKGEYSGDIRIDPAPRWNRTSDAILVPGIADNGTRQMFMIRLVDSEASASK